VNQALCKHLNQRAYRKMLHRMTENNMEARRQAIMSQSTLIENNPQRMLETINGACVLCHNALTYFHHSTSIAQNGLYNSDAPVDEKMSSHVADAIKEARSGSDKLKASFAMIQGNLFLSRNHPILISQSMSIPIEDFEEIEARSTSQYPKLKLRKALLRFVHRCEEIASHQKQLLDAVAGQIQAENRPFGAYGYPPFHPYHHYHQYAMPGPYNVPLEAVGSSKSDRMPYQYGPRASSNHEESFEPIPLAKSEKQCNSSSTLTLEDEFEPLSIEKGMDLPLNEAHLTPAKTSTSSAGTLPPIKPDEIFADSKIQCHSQGHATFAAKSTNTLTSKTKKARAKTPPSLRSASTSKEPLKIRRTGSGGLLEKRRRSTKRQSRRTKKEKEKPKSQSPDDMLALALGGRMDFMQKDTVYQDSLHSELSKSVDNSTAQGSSCDENSIDSDEPLGFPFEDIPDIPLTSFPERSYSY